MFLFRNVLTRVGNGAYAECQGKSFQPSLLEGSNRMLLTHWLTLFERDWQFALDFRTNRLSRTPSPLMYPRGKHRAISKQPLPSIPTARPTKVPAHWKPRRRQCNST